MINLLSLLCITFQNSVTHPHTFYLFDKTRNHTHTHLHLHNSSVRAITPKAATWTWNAHNWIDSSHPFILAHTWAQLKLSSSILSHNHLHFLYHLLFALSITHHDHICSEQQYASLSHTPLYFAAYHLSALSAILILFLALLVMTLFYTWYCWRKPLKLVSSASSMRGGYDDAEKSATDSQHKLLPKLVQNKTLLNVAGSAGSPETIFSCD